MPGKRMFYEKMASRNTKTTHVLLRFRYLRATERPPRMRGSSAHGDPIHSRLAAPLRTTVRSRQDDAVTTPNPGGRLPGAMGTVPQHTLPYQSCFKQEGGRKTSVLGVTRQAIGPGPGSLGPDNFGATGHCLWFLGPGRQAMGPL